MTKKTNEQNRQSDFFSVCGTCPVSCCSDVRPPLSDKRMALIQGYLKTNKLAFETPFDRNVYSFPRETSDKHCVFQDGKNKRCMVHSAKPETCVAGPVTFDINLKTGRIEWWLKTANICPLAGALYKDKKALENHLQNARKELLRLVRDLDAEALRAILKIDEPDTFKISEEALDAEALKKLKPSS